MTRRRRRKRRNEAITWIVIAIALVGVLAVISLH